MRGVAGCVAKCREVKEVAAAVEMLGVNHKLFSLCNTEAWISA